MARLKPIAQRTVRMYTGSAAATIAKAWRPHCRSSGLGRGDNNAWLA